MSRCRTCGAEIVWAWTEQGRRMPVDVEPDPSGNVKFLTNDCQPRDNSMIEVGPPNLFEGIDEGPRYRSHFASCPDASEHRR